MTFIFERASGTLGSLQQRVNKRSWCKRCRRGEHSFCTKQIKLNHGMKQPCTCKHEPERIRQ